MADQFWQPYWNNVERRRQDTRYQNALARQDMLDQRAFQQQDLKNALSVNELAAGQQKDYREALQNVPVVAQRILDAPDNIRPAAYQAALDMYGLRGRQEVPQQWGPEAQTFVQSYAATAEPEKVDYQLVQDASGQFVRVPKAPGADISPTGVMGEKKTPLVNVTNVPKLPTGYEWYDPQDPSKGMQPIAGSKDAVAREQAEQQRREAARASTSKADVVLNKVDEALDKVGFTTTGLVGFLTGQIPGTGSYDLKKTVDTVQANLGFDKLQQMRDMSPTGGALGQVSERELDLLKSAVASLDTAQSQEQVARNLMQVKQHYENWKETIRLANQQEPQTKKVNGKEARLAPDGFYYIERNGKFYRVEE